MACTACCFAACQARTHVSSPAGCGWSLTSAPPEHPGNYAGNRERDRAAVYYILRPLVGPERCGALGVRFVKAKPDKVDWAEALADALLSRQQADGSWVNDAEQVR